MYDQDKVLAQAEIVLCRRCGRRLKTEEAKQRGMGKTCWEKSHTSSSKRLFEVNTNESKLEGMVKIGAEGSSRLQEQE